MRARKGSARRRSNQRLFKEARGGRGGRSKLLRTVKETLLRARAFAYRDRRVKKREFRQLWITRITAACRARGMSYSQFIHGVTVAGLGLNRKSLSELAIHHPAVFDELVEVARGAASSAA
jgi:large subunit ribosomal protein L20